MDKNLFNQVVELTGLPSNYIEPRLESLLKQRGINPDTVTMDELRLVLVDFLQDIILEAKESSKDFGIIN